MKNYLLLNIFVIFTILSSVYCKDYKCEKIRIIDYNKTFCELRNVIYKEKSDGFNLKADEDDYLEGDFVRQLIEEIKVTSSTLRKIPNVMFMQARSLKKLDISSVGLRYLDRLSFNNGQNLLELNMYNNQLKSLTDSYFVHTSSLLVLDLSQNQIKNIKENAFAFLKNLEKLSLSNNEITSLGDDIFEPLKNLKWLWLDRNKISMISSFVFVSNGNLQGLYLNKNKIDAISTLAFDEAKRLQYLFLTENSCINQDFKGFKISGNIAIKYEMKNCLLEFDRLLPDDHLDYNVTKSLKEIEKKISACNNIKKHLLDSLKTFEDQQSD